MSINNDDLPYVLHNGCRYYVEDAENDTLAGIQHKILCAACLKPILFVNGYHKPSCDVDVAPHFKHYPGDVEACIGYVQLRKSTSCITSLKHNAENANKTFVLECESSDCVEIVPPPYVIDVEDVNNTYREELQNTYWDACDRAIKDKTFRIKAKKNCPFFNKSRCQSCEAKKCFRNLAAQRALAQCLEAKTKQDAMREAASQIALASAQIPQPYRLVKDEEERKAAVIRKSISGRDWSHTYWMQFLQTHHVLMLCVNTKCITRDNTISS